MRFWRNDAIEVLAEERLQQLEELLGSALTPPVPVDVIAESVLDLNILWQEIEELDGETILGAIQPKTRRITMNEKRRSLFEEKPGLEAFTKGHEMGHWDLFVDQSTLDHPSLFGSGQGAFSFRQSPSGQVIVVKKIMATEEGRDFLRQLKKRSDESDEARAVNRYAGAILMPQDLIRKEAMQVQRTSWPDLYQLAEKFNVTISALTVRLQQLNLLCIRDGELYESHGDTDGQGRLAF